MAAKIAVFGSVNMDLVTRVSRFPRPGETIRGLSFSRIPGGKGANQAVAAAKLGGDVSFYGLIGDDGVGEGLYQNLKDHGVNPSAVETRPGPSGVALIQVNEGGENQIVIIPGANGEVDADYVDSNLEDIVKADVLLLQLEVPLDTIAYLLGLLEETSEDTPEVILDPAPAEDLRKLPLSAVDMLTPNEGELEALFPDKDPGRTVDNLIRQGVRGVLVTRGGDGVSYHDANGNPTFPSFTVEPVDTTAAGDAFTGGLGVALGEGWPIKESILFASAAGAISTTREGAQPSLPQRADVLQLLEERSNDEIDAKSLTGEIDE